MRKAEASNYFLNVTFEGLADWILFTVGISRDSLSQELSKNFPFLAFIQNEYFFVVQ